MLAHGKKCFEIAEAIGCDPTTVSKEIKKNRRVSKEAKYEKKILCKILDRFPYVCLNCKHKYTNCILTQLRYDASFAQSRYEFRLHNSRRGLNLTKEEHEELNALLLNGLKDKKSIYSIIYSSNFDISVSTVYRYISEKKVSVTKRDLPYAITYKKRKRKIKEYDYPDNKIDRNNRTYVDYLSYKKSHINEMSIQMDFLGSIKTDKKSILVLIIPEIMMPFLFIIENKNSSKVVQIYNELERKFGIEKFKEIFPSILTNRDPCFSDIEGIEFSKELGEQRTNLFFCDAFRSNQKANVENMNKQLRKFFPKGYSIDGFTQEKVLEINRLINEQPIRLLDGKTPKEAFMILFGAKTYLDYFGK